MSKPELRPDASVDEIVELDALALSRAIATRAVSCQAVMTAYLAHIDAVNPRVNAIFRVSRPMRCSNRPTPVTASWR